MSKSPDLAASQRQQAFESYVRLRWFAVPGAWFLLLLVRIVAGSGHGPVPFGLMTAASLGLNTYLARQSARLSQERAALMLPLSVDLLFLTLLVHYTGGLASPFAWAFILLVFTGSLLFGRFLGLPLAAASSLLYGGTLLAEYLGWVEAVPIGPLGVHDPAELYDPTRLVASASVYVVLFFVTALLSGVLYDVAESRRIVIEEKETASRRLLHRVVEVQEEERRRIARELHDEIGQSLTMLSMGLEAVAEHSANGTASPAAISQLTRLKEAARQSLTRMERIIYDLRPMVLDDFGLVPALEWWVENLPPALGLQTNIEVVVSGKPRRLPDQVETVLFRTTQEAVMNALRHAKARSIEVRILFGPDRADIEVMDDGRGFDPEIYDRSGIRGRRGLKGFGLLGMEERLAAVGGRRALDRRPAAGPVFESPYRWRIDARDVSKDSARRRPRYRTGRTPDDRSGRRAGSEQRLRRAGHTPCRCRQKPLHRAAGYWRLRL